MLHFFVTPFWIACVHIFAFCNLCKAFAEDKKQHYCGDSFGMGSLAKDYFQSSVNRISIKTLEK